MFRMTGAGSKFDGRLVNDLGVDFIRDLKADYQANGAEAIAGLRRNTALSYFNLVPSLSSGDVRRHEPVSAPVQNDGQPPQAASTEVKDPYRKLNRVIAIEKLKNELARMEAEEAAITRAAEEELEQQLAEARAQRDAVEKARRAQSETSNS